ncbi:hypothetical protein HAALTHF_16480n [Vreelandella aquamarina]|nr:hypothetical protein HAALTHF_16480n [Halomonas axialensis]
MFDVVLDLSEGALNVASWELPPPGYLRLAWERQEAERADVLESVTELVGEFDKPRYFQVNTDLCAHSSSGNVGCTRCLDVCPADAISSIQGRIESRIEIDPFLCQGVGSCTSACPTGAIEFRLPETRRQQDTLATWLTAYRDAGGEVPVLRFITHDSLEAERAAGVTTPGHIIDAPLEELGAAGHDQWLTALASGASEVRIQLHDGMPPRLSAFLEHQIAQAHSLLAALGHDAARIKLLSVDAEGERDALPSLTPLTESPLSFNEPNKRARLNVVLARLAELGRLAVNVTPCLKGRLTAALMSIARPVRCATPVSAIAQRLRLNPAVIPPRLASWKPIVYSAGSANRPALKTPSRWSQASSRHLRAKRGIFATKRRLSNVLAAVSRLPPPAPLPPLKPNWPTTLTLPVMP